MSFSPGFSVTPLGHTAASMPRTAGLSPVPADDIDTDLVTVSGLPVDLVYGPQARSPVYQPGLNTGYAPGLV